MSDATSVTRSRASAHSLAFYSSSSSATSLWSGESEVDREGFLQSSFRAGGPVLASLPAEIVILSPSYHQRTELGDNIHEIRAQAMEILTEHQISPSLISATGRLSKIRSEPEPIPTVFVIVPHLSPPTSGRWREAARKIHAQLSPRFPDISVELIDEKLVSTPYCYPLDPSHTIIDKWTRICTEILRTSNIQEWTGIACWRYGVERRPSDNPVTVIVSLLESAVGPFTTSLRRVKGILAAATEPHVDILFMKNERWSYYGEPQIGPTLHKEMCSQFVVPGVSIGIRNSSAGTSTFGGIVELKYRNDPDWHPLGLTCFHCVYPPANHRVNFSNVGGADDVFASWEFHPIAPKNQIGQRLLQIEQPSSFDLRNTIAKHNARIQDFKNNEFQTLDAKAKAIEQGANEIMMPYEKAQYSNVLKCIESLQEEIDVCQRFLDSQSQQMGYIYAGSGYDRTIAVQDGTLRLSDWALISIHRSRLHTEPEIRNHNKPFWYLRGSEPLPFFNPGTTSPPLTWGDTLCKTGRTTQYTEGPYNCIKDVHLVRVRDSTQPGGSRIVTTWEHGIGSPFKNSFAEPGDSGCFIYRPDGGVVGMLFGGWERLPIRHFSEISDVFRDIKDITHAEDVRILGPY